MKGDKKEEKQGNYHIVERHYGSFSRSFELPEGIDVEKVEAHFKKGVPKINFPKASQA